MAALPFLAVGPNAIISLLGLLRGPDRTVPTPPEDWRDATVDVVIPALNEEATIVLCLASVAKQTRKPRSVILVDDGSTDRTCEVAEEFCKSVNLPITVIKRRNPIGKTPTIKRQSREFDSDVEFILDGDTILVSSNYIERTIQELYQGVGIASACGTVLPTRNKDRRRELERRELQEFSRRHPDLSFFRPATLIQRFRKLITNMYRDVLYLFLQHFVYHGQMVFFGTITNPVGCAVAYRRKYIKDLFDHYEPIFGDDLTNSEDIFIGFALVNQGYRNIQLMDVFARSEEPEVQRLPRQLYLWSSSFLQSCYYFDSLLRSPFRFYRRFVARRRAKREGVEEKRKIKEAYRQSFGRDYTDKYGRPMGWIILASLIEKIFFPVVLLIMIIMARWEPLAITLLAEGALFLVLLFIIARGRRLLYLLKGLIVIPIRYIAVFLDLVTTGIFMKDLWITRNRRLRK